MNVRAVGEYIRSQRVNARLSLRSVSRVAGVSIPYLSQVERGLRRPSADILQAIAKALRISAETLYVQAGILDDRPAPDVAAAVMADPFITERQKRALLQIYDAFREESARRSDAEPVAPPPPARRRRAVSSSKPGGGVEPGSGRGRRPAGVHPSAAKRRKEV